MRKSVSAAFVLLLGGCDPSQLTKDTAEHEVGRYVIVHSLHVERDTVLLDTVTGKTWQLVVYTDLENDPSAWEPMARSDNAQELQALAFDHPPKRGKKQK